MSQSLFDLTKGVFFSFLWFFLHLLICSSARVQCSANCEFAFVFFSSCVFRCLYAVGGGGGGGAFGFRGTKREVAGCWHLHPRTLTEMTAAGGIYLFLLVNAQLFLGCGVQSFLMCYVISPVCCWFKCPSYFHSFCIKLSIHGPISHFCFQILTD